MRNSLALKMSKGPGNLRHEGILFSADSKSYIYFPFEITEEVYSIKAKLYYYQKPGNMLFLYCFDPEGLRGRGKDNAIGQGTSYLEITADRAGYGCTPGPLPKGKWMLEIDVQDVYGFCPYRLTLEINTGRSNTEKTVAFPMKKGFSQGIKDKRAKWYRGELHLHSKESDGEKDVEELLQMARDAGLDFVSITDHNTISQWRLISRESPVLVLPGTEVSTFYGHANVWGIDGWVDWRVGENGMDINDVIDETHERGGIFSINHPMAPGIDGHLSWSFSETDFSKVDSIEILNAPWFDQNRDGNIKARRLWNELLNHGIKITGVAGSDMHSFDERHRRLGYLVNYVYAENLSEKAILSAIKKGKVFATLGPKIYFEAMTEKMAGIYTLGDTIYFEKESLGEIQFKILLKDVEAGQRLVIIKNGVEFFEVKAPQKTVTFKDILKDQCWYRAEIHGAPLFNSGDTLVAFTNPIFTKLL
ncbi:MAG: hypothetical protein PWR06_761 [Thermoanaerobacteraceae bacterium]|nr:hypothetical protein [Thermoanaerobacteraceae bacterium]